MFALRNVPRSARSPVSVPVLRTSAGSQLYPLTANSLGIISARKALHHSAAGIARNALFVIGVILSPRGQAPAGHGIVRCVSQPAI
jgi:hypothetical protein